MLQNLSPLIKEYESLIEALQTQAEKHKIEQEQLRFEIKNILEENKRLSEDVKRILSAQSFNVYQTNSESEMINSLQSQLALLSQEKDSTTDLWQSALKEIDYLEQQLEMIQRDKSTQKTKTDKKDNELNEEIEQTESYKEKYETAEKKFEETHRQLQNITSEYKTTLEQLSRIQIEVIEIKGKFVETKQEKEKYENNLEKCQQYIKELQIRDKDSIQALETALIERDAILLREKKYQEETLQLKKALSDMIDEAGIKVKNEIELVKNQYNKKLKILLKDMKSIKTNLTETQTKLDESNKLNQSFEREITDLKKFTSSDENAKNLLKTQQQLESTFQKLILTERKNAKLTTERDNIKLDIEQMVHSFERDLKARELEKNTLQDRIKILQNDLKDSNDSLLKTTIELEDVISKFVLMQNELERRIELDAVLQNLSEELNVIKKSHMEETTEFEKHINSQQDISDRWKQEVTDIIAKLQNRIKELKTENGVLLKENDTLWRKLHSTNNSQHEDIFQSI